MVAHEPPVDPRDMWRLKVIEGRRAQAEGFTFVAPGLAITAQAFLLTIVLGHDTSSVARVVAALAGLIAAVTAAQLYAKQVYIFDFYEMVIEHERARLTLPEIQREDIRKTITPPENTTYAERRWEKGWRKRLVVDQRTVKFWLLTLVGFVVIDFFLLVYSIVALAGANPHWLG